jgi:hypothetical protein
MNQEVTDHIAAIQAKQPWHGPLCSNLREAVHAAIPDVQERIQYNKPHFLKNGKYAAVISTSRDAVSFTIFNTAGLELPEGFSGPPERQTIKLRQGDSCDVALLTALVSQAAASL